ncbi:hypothetical protein RBSH_01290 [Rhodopirellula baltica SH28]|uniref:Uncharacterized protein n=1 Tax=Rhodopirellula baltica SH28 TaxID=993517 RepID=K5EBZ0_RHOBT|nr:hypothetical protein RBSH_01290 [Rhodopirellula baltica SH28]
MGTPATPITKQPTMVVGIMHSFAGNAQCHATARAGEHTNQQAPRQRASDLDLSNRSNAVVWIGMWHSQSIDRSR